MLPKRSSDTTLDKQHLKLFRIRILCNLCCVVIRMKFWRFVLTTSMSNIDIVARQELTLALVNTVGIIAVRQQVLKQQRQDVRS